AVVDALGIDGMDVFAQTSSGCWVAAALATRHPHLIRRLVLFQPTPTGEDFCNDVVAGQLPLAEANWVMWTETVVGQVHSWRPSREAIRRMAATWRQTESLEHVRAIGNWSGSVDVTEILKAINVPTLVLRREHTTDAATDLAAQLIPDAQLVMVPGENYQPHLDHPDELFAEIDRFLGTGLSPGHARATNGRRAKGNGHREPLSPRELDVLTLIAAGRTNPEIAEALTIAPATASRHVHNILEKLGMSRRSEAAAYALREGLVE
ncbi:MAG: LuxR C-terminal-related transcriptional regulator, partial [Tepidiformaceae bacterium]